MKILIFTEGTVIMHKNGANCSRNEIIKQVQNKEPTVKDYFSYIPIRNSQKKLTKWKKQKAEIVYITSRRKLKEIKNIKSVLKKYKFPDGKLLFRKNGQNYKEIVEKLIPDVLIEDDCQSIGKNEIIINHLKPAIKTKISSILVKEFGGINHLSDNIKHLNNLGSYFVVIRGPLGSGKSTLAKQLAKIINAEYISIDRVLDKYKLTKDHEAGYISQKSFIKANEIIVQKVKNKLEKGISIIFDGNFYWKSQIDDLIKRLKFPHFVFTLKAPLKMCIERDSLRKKMHGPEAAKAVDKKSTEFNYGKIIDGSKSLKKSIKKIVFYLLKSQTLL
jgi:predicted kinase